MSAALLLMVASGFAALGYQIVWTQQAALWLGHESAAVLAVVAAFFGGLALGSLLLGGRVARSSMPARWYACCEAVIAGWSLAITTLFPFVSRWLIELLGVQPSPLLHWAVVFGGTFLVFLPATAAMGATLPAMERILGGLRERGVRIATLYAGNTLGAVLGVLATAFWLVPRFGLTATTYICAGLNLVCAATAAWIFAGRSQTPSDSSPAPRVGTGTLRPLTLLAATGLLGIGYEVLVVRVLSQVAENTVYTFAILLAVYLVGTTLGAAAYARWLARRENAARLRDDLLLALASACLLGVLALVGADTAKNVVLHLLGPGMSTALTAETMLAIAAFLPPTFVMGALFSHLSATAAAAGIPFGRALGINTLGAALAPVIFGVLLVTRLDPKFAVLIIAAGYLALGSRQAWSSKRFRLGAAAAMALAVTAPSLVIVDVPEGGRLVSHVQGALGTVSIVEDAEGVASLHIDNRQQEGSSATLLADARQAWLPLLLHPSPHRALFLGLGTGVTSVSATGDPNLQVDVVELLPEVVQASAYFTGSSSHERWNAIAADARRFVRASRQTYEVIVSDNFHPARSGSGSLYTVEHFAAVRERLAPNGVFCQWLPLHQLDLETLRSIVRSFMAVYPQGLAMLATNSLDTPVVGLLGRNDAGRFDVPALLARLNDASIGESARQFGIADEFALMGSFIAGPAELARFAAGAPINTDDRPVVAYRAPRITYAPDSPPRDRLIQLLRTVGITPEEVLDARANARFASRLNDYWRARDRFIEVGRDVQPTTDVRRMLAQVREPLLDVLRISGDFQPAYDPLLRMAAALARVDVAAARELLIQLQRLQPARTEASIALRELSAHTTA